MLHCSTFRLIFWPVYWQSYPPCEPVKVKPQQAVVLRNLDRTAIMAGVKNLETAKKMPILPPPGRYGLLSRDQRSWDKIQKAPRIEVHFDTKPQFRRKQRLQEYTALNNLMSQKNAPLMERVSNQYQYNSA